MTWPAGPRQAAIVLMVAALIAAVGGCTDSNDNGSDEAFCARLGETPALSTVIERFTSATPNDLDQRLDQAEKAYGELRSSAPSEIDDEVDVLVDLVDAVIGAVRANPDDSVAAADQVRSVVDEHPEAEQASTEVTAYASHTCNIELSPTTVPEP